MSGRGRGRGAANLADALTVTPQGPRRGANAPRAELPRPAAPAAGPLPAAPAAEANPAPAEVANHPQPRQGAAPQVSVVATMADEDSNEDQESFAPLVTSYSRRESDHARHGLQTSGESKLLIDKSGVSMYIFLEYLLC